MEKADISTALLALSQVLERCAEDIPYELSAQNNLYFRLLDAAKESQALRKALEGMDF